MTLNFLLFQVGWLVCVLGANTLAAVVALAMVGVHLALVSQAPLRELLFIVTGTLIGSAIDSLWLQLGVMSTTAATAPLIPLWLVALWALFMTTLCHSLAWIGSYRWLPFLLAPFAGALAYWSASKLSAVTITPLPLALVAIALGWLLVFPLLMEIRKRWFVEVAA